MLITDIRKSRQNPENNYTNEEMKKTTAHLLGFNNRFI